MILLISFSELYFYHDKLILEHFHDSPKIPSSPFAVDFFSLPSPRSCSPPPQPLTSLSDSLQSQTCKLQAHTCAQSKPLTH